MRFLFKATIALCVLGGGAAAVYPAVHGWWTVRNRPSFRQTSISRGEIILVVNSTGTVQPVRRVTVGSFVSGPISALLVDFNSEVRKGQLLAKIDPRLYNAALARDEATCATARAEVARVEALLQQAVNDERRGEALRAKKKDYLSDAELDKLHFSRRSLEAQLAVAQANVRQAAGALETSRANLGYTEIQSPVDGVVIDRKVDQGQTIAAAFQTPEMFVVAPELDQRVLIYASVDEADIGLIRQAQQRSAAVEFTVDAYRDDLFEGHISQVRLSPTVTQNVVTYTVVVESPNRDRKLLPGMTANLSFQIEKRRGILRVPNAALRFYPRPEHVCPEDRKLVDGTAEDAPTPEEQEGLIEIRHSAAERAQANRRRNRHHVWVVGPQGLLHAVAIATGISDNRSTEILSGTLSVGQEVVTGLRAETR